MSGSSYSYSPYSLGPRLPERSTVYSSSPTPPLSPPKSASPRKVVSDFGAFKAPANASVFGTAVQSTPFSLAGGKAAFGGMRNGNSAAAFGDDDEDEDDGGGRQRIELREDSITLDQVSCIFIRQLVSIKSPLSRLNVLRCRAHGVVCVGSLVEFD